MMNGSLDPIPTKVPAKAEKDGPPGGTQIESWGPCSGLLQPWLLGE